MFWTAMRNPRRLVPRWALGALCVLAFSAWWMWPMIAGHDDRLDVLSASDPLLTRAERPLATYVRDIGQSFRRAAPDATSCNVVQLAAEIERRDPQAVVLASAVNGCDLREFVATLRREHRTVVIVLEPGVPADAAPFGARVVDSGLLVGVEPASTSRPCEWWDREALGPCADGGEALVRDASGVITSRGFDRIGRAVAARLR